MDEPEPKIELDLSPYEIHRNELMETLKIPTLSEAKNSLGLNLAKIIFDQCDEALKVDFGLKPPLKGYWGDMWISPSNLLAGKVALTAPASRKHVKALTHQGILEIGEDVEKKFLHGNQLDKETALAEQKKILMDSFDTVINVQVKEVEARERAACQREIERLTEEFEQRIVAELDDLEARLRVEYQNKFQEQRASLKLEWEHVMNNQVKHTAKKLTIYFWKEMCKQQAEFRKEVLSQHSKSEISKEFYIGLERQKCIDKLNALRHQLECKHLANMMYILCTERRKCVQEKALIEQYYATKIRELENVSFNHNQKILELKNEIQDLQKEVKLRESCVLRIIKEFHKFIKYVLKNSPIQVEFLLSTEKMLLFELTDTLMKSPYVKCQPGEDIIQRKEPEKPIIDTKDAKDFKGDDYNFNKLSSTKGKNEHTSPAFYYKNKLYVREDFRKMISNIQISSSNHPRSDDDTISSFSSSLTSLPSLDVKQQMPQKVSLASLMVKIIAETESEDKPSEDKKIKEGKEYYSFDPYYLKGAVDYSKMNEYENSPLILAARSSLEIMKEKMSPNLSKTTSETARLDTARSETLQINKYRSTLSEEKVSSGLLVEEVRDSVILKKVSLAKMKSSELIFEQKPEQSNIINNSSTEEETKPIKPKTHDKSGRKTIPKNERVVVFRAKNSHIASFQTLQTLSIHGPIKGKKTKEKHLHQPQIVKVVGDPHAKEHLQEVNEFTAHRIHSFVKMIRDCPVFLKAFQDREKSEMK